MMWNTSEKVAISKSFRYSPRCMLMHLHLWKFWELAHSKRNTILYICYIIFRSSELQLLVENSFGGISNKLTNYKKFLSSVEQKDGSFVYQDVKLEGFEASKGAIKKSFGDMIKIIYSFVDRQFDDLKENKSNLLKSLPNFRHWNLAWRQKFPI